MTILDFFNPHDFTHIQSLLKFQRTGLWPKNFLPDNLLFPMGWQNSLNEKLAQTWLNYMLSLLQTQHPVLTGLEE